MSATKVISARVPVEVAQMFEQMCKQHKISKSQAIKNMVNHVDKVPSRAVSSGSGIQIAKGGKVKSVDDIKLPQEVVNGLGFVASLGGGILAGKLAYHGVKEIMPEDRFTQDQIEAWSSIAAIAVGMATVPLIINVLESVFNQKG